MFLKSKYSGSARDCEVSARHLFLFRVPFCRISRAALAQETG
jgi:hypothetical protein